MKNVLVVIGSDQIGQAIARRVEVGKHILLADLRQESVDAQQKFSGNWKRG
jgi:NAD(P)-dependent dehydrogenase (short-subunit alcohol dehydrogenase family)